jgi:hypothetical protein
MQWQSTQKNVSGAATVWLLAKLKTMFLTVIAATGLWKA